ncbi:MAG: hypothetical protein HOV80_09910, partial [Polyangiaceae bacterium]|nr:hypothetical protein [Polyangiaceae bacterium]
VVSPLTPLGRAFRERPARVVAVTNVGLWRASIDDDSWERLASPAELTGLDRSLPAIIVLVEGDTPIRALAELLKIIDGARAPVALAIAKHDRSVSPVSDTPAHACPGVRWRGTIPASDRPPADAAVQDLGRRCAAAVPSAAGMSMEIVLRSSGAGRTEVCIERRDAPSVRLENCVVEGAKAIDIGNVGERAGAFRMTFDVPPVRATCAE